MSNARFAEFDKYRILYSKYPEYRQGGGRTRRISKALLRAREDGLRSADIWVSL